MFAILTIFCFYFVIFSLKYAKCTNKNPPDLRLNATLVLKKQETHNVYRKIPDPKLCFKGKSADQKCTERSISAKVITILFLFVIKRKS